VSEAIPIAGVRVGHWTGDRTGVTVLLAPEGTVGAGEVRGGAPASRELALLEADRTVTRVDAVVFAGGSAFGLAAADGVMRFLEEQGVGFDTGIARVPIVPAAVLFDLGVGDPKARPGPEAGYQACESASDHVEEGNVGAGTGATVANLHGHDRAVKGGLGTASNQDGDLIVGALAAVNAFGEVIDENDEVLAGARPESDDEGRRPPGLAPSEEAGQHTTLVVVATNARLTKERAHLLSIAGHDGIDSAVRPAHTRWDGDTVFALATGEVDADQRSLEAMAVGVVAEAIRRAVLLAQSVPGFPTAREGLRP
jgi:L-aminopeptidase/D-esterase-like protein